MHLKRWLSKFSYPSFWYFIEGEKIMLKKFMIVICLWMISISMIQPIKAEETLSIGSEHAVLINLNDNLVVFSKAADEKTYPASITKVMSALVAIEHMDRLDEKVVLTKDMFEGLYEAEASLAGFEVGNTVTIEDLLYGTLLASGAEAVNGLAYKTAGSVPSFVKLMNKKAKQLGMNHTNFTNPTGLHDDNHYTTCNDLAKLLQAAIKNKDFYKIFCAKKYQTSKINKNSKGLIFKSTLSRQIQSLNYKADYIKGGKTGFTPEAGMCLASVAKNKKDAYLLITTQNGHDNLEPYNVMDAIKVYDYYFDHYENRIVKRKGEELLRVNVLWNFRNKEFVYESKNDLTALVPKGINNEDIKFNYVGNSDIKTPVKKGALLGTLEIKANKEVVKSIEIHALKSVDRNFVLYYCDKIGDFFEQNRSLLLIGIASFISLGIGLIWYKKNKHYIK